MKRFNFLFAKKAAAQSKSIVKQAKTEAIQKAFDEVIETLNKFKCTAYLTKIEPNANAFSSGSKFGGFPYLLHEEDWPYNPKSR